MDENCQIVSFGRFDITPSVKTADPQWDDLAVIATRNLVLFPEVTIPIALIRDNARKVAAYAADNHIPVGICCQLNPSDDHIADYKKVFSYGVVADVVQILDLPGGGHTALVRARGKFKILGQSEGKTVPGSELNVVAKSVADKLSEAPDKQFEVLLDSIKNVCKRISSAAEGNTGIMLPFDNTANPTEFVNTIATNMPIDPTAKMKLLAINMIKQRAFKLFQALQILLDNIELANNIKERAREEMSQQSRNAFLQQQMNAIREELYGDEDEETSALKKKLAGLSLSEPIAKQIEKEIDRLNRMNPSTPDYATLLTYIETVLDLPWSVSTPLNDNFEKAEEVLNNDHYGLEKVKNRILEQLAVLMHNPEGKAPILCLVGAPGVGKTSLGQSIAKALGRNYQRVSLGGLHDEAEIRGHRRTYIGAMPGRIMDSIRKTKSNNPVILLDEVDKIGTDFKGDPSAALLEVLDPEQNCKFHDNYIDVDFDLSNALFIATANTLSTLSQPLLDRMEIIEISGYLVEEKIEIARRHLLPRVLSQHNMESGSMTFSEDALRQIIEQYTSESGVRQLEKALATVVRKTVLKRMQKKDYPKEILPEHLYEYLGLPRHISDRYESNEFPGVVTGLAWTAVGGEILFIEASLSKGKGEKLTLTGNLGDVMKESAVIALQFVKSHTDELGISSEMFDTYNLHIHVPEGAIPKDGPSAGITMATAIVSAFTRLKVKPRIAMTGEITLRGKVLPVGGIKEKILAAKRAGITDIILSEDNRRDVEDISELYVKDLEFHYVKTVMDVIHEALTDEKA